MIDLLDEPYLKMEYNICDFKDDKQLNDIAKTNHFHEKIREKIFNNKTRGLFVDCECFKSIYLFTYRMKNEVKNLKLQCALMLFHEIRHCYQSYYMDNVFDIKYKNLSFSENKKLHHSQPDEIDADEFARKIILNNKRKINDILKINFTWDNNDLIW